MIAITELKANADTQLLAEELAAALAAVNVEGWGMSVLPDTVTVYLKDDATSEQIAAAQAAILAHPTKAESEYTRRQRLMKRAQTALATETLATLKQEIIAASTIAALKVILVKVLRLAFLCAAALGLTGEDPDQ